MDLGKVVAPACLTLWLGMLAPAFADDGADVYENEVAEQAETLTAEDLSDEQLERYVRAAKEIASIRLQHADDIASEGVDTAESAQQKMAETIEDHGLSVREYREIAHLTRNHGQVNRRVKNIESRIP